MSRCDRRINVLTIGNFDRSICIWGFFGIHLLLNIHNNRVFLFSLIFKLVFLKVTHIDLENLIGILLKKVDLFLNI